MRPQSPSAPARRSARGIALVVVMIMVLAMIIIAGAFAFAMKVETRLSVRTQFNSEMEWLGRSGVEYARWVLDAQRRIPGENTYDALNQFWAGGPGPTNTVDNPFLDQSMKGILIGDGRVSVELTDTERRININMLNDNRVMELALQVAGAQAGDSTAIANAIADWKDPDDDNARADGGAESAFYNRLDPPYFSKNGPLDDITELLKIRGVTPELFWGPRLTGGRIETPGNLRIGRRGEEEEGLEAGLIDVFCAISSGRVNVNTATLPVLTVLLGGDRGRAQQVINQRAGLDGVDGTFDDAPARTTADLPRLLGGASTVGAAPAGQQLLMVQSATFEAHVLVEMGGSRKRFVGLIRRGVGRESQVMLFHPE